MSIGVNWAEIWTPVWKAVWTLEPPIPPEPPAPDTAVAGGWGSYAPRRRKKPLPAAVSAPTPEQIEAEQQRLVARQALRRAEQRDQQVLAQLKAIYAEQDALARSLDTAQARQTQIDEQNTLILILQLAS
jgi:hypothetical protein